MQSSEFTNKEKAHQKHHVTFIEEPSLPSYDLSSKVMNSNLLKRHIAVVDAPVDHMVKIFKCGLNILLV